MAEHHHNPSESSRIIPASQTAENMKQASIRFLESLTPELRSKCLFDFSDVERRRWHYVPREMFVRQGVNLRQMNGRQRDAAFGLLACALSPAGYKKTNGIMNLEKILGELEKSRGILRSERDPALYYFSVFGDPSDAAPWGWRAEGHHVSLNFTIVSRQWIAPNPFFLGANPAEVRSGDRKGLRLLAKEEDLARELLNLLDKHQRRKTVISSDAPADILTRNAPKVEFDAAEGLAAEAMNAEQRLILDRLIHAYVDRLPDELANVELKKLRDTNLNNIHFAWAGAGEPGKPHYYRLHGPFFFLEYDNTQNDANHIHTVWRHLEDDFGFDLLRWHYDQGHKAELGHLNR